MNIGGLKSTALIMLNVGMVRSTRNQKSTGEIPWLQIPWLQKRAEKSNVLFVSMPRFWLLQESQSILLYLSFLMMGVNKRASCEGYVHMLRFSCNCRKISASPKCLRCIFLKVAQPLTARKHNPACFW